MLLDLPALIPVLEWGVGLSNYPIQLVGCLVLAGVLIWGLRANRVSAFTLAFSAWFAVLWALVAVEFFVSVPLERQTSRTLTEVAVVAILSMLFGVPALLACRSLRIRLAPEVDGRRGGQFFLVLLLAHAGHLLLALMFASVR